MRFLMFLACGLLVAGAALADEPVPVVDTYDPATEVVVYRLHTLGWPNARVHFKVEPGGVEVEKTRLEAYIAEKLERDFFVIYCAVALEHRARLDVDMLEDEDRPGGYIGRRTGNCTEVHMKP